LFNFISEPPKKVPGELLERFFSTRSMTDLLDRVGYA